MSIRNDNYLKSRFETGDIPTQKDFADLIDSKLSINNFNSYSGNTKSILDNINNNILTLSGSSTSSGVTTTIFNTYTGATETRLENIEDDVTFLGQHSGSTSYQLSGDTLFINYTGSTDNRITDNENDIIYLSGQSGNSGGVDGVQLGNLLSESNIPLNQKGTYNEYTPASNFTPTFSSLTEGKWVIIPIVLDGIKTIVQPGNSYVLADSFVDGTAPDSGNYNFIAMYLGGELQLSLVNRKFKTLAVIPSDNLEGEYLFSGNTNDTSVNSRNAVNNGAILGVDRNASADSAYIFDGVDDNMTLPASLITALQAVGQGSISVWIRPDNINPATIQSVLSFCDTNTVTGIEIDMMTDGRLRVVCFDQGVTQWLLTTDNAITSNDVWVNIIITHNGIQPAIYINNIFVAQSFGTGINNNDRTIWFNSLPGIDNARIGCRQINSGSNSNFFDGGIDNIRLYTDLLTLTERQAIASE